MTLLAGIDGGGTRTRLALATDDGVVMSLVEGGPYSFMDCGLDGARAELRSIWQAAWRSLGTDPRPADALFMGTGSVLSEADARTNRELAIEVGLVACETAVEADNDAWNAHAGGLCGRPGILLIAGTGSACLGKNADGRTWRAGGWGYLLEDAGSAHALGQAAMVAATRAADRRGPPSVLQAIVCEALAIGDMKEIFRRVHHDGVLRRDVAALAPRVVEAAEQGDEVAGRIVSAGAASLAEMIVTVARQLAMERPELAFTGGLVTNAASFRAELLERLRVALPGFSMAGDGMAPVFGAVLLAFVHATGCQPRAHFIENLRAADAGSR